MKKITILLILLAVLITVTCSGCQILNIRESEIRESVVETSSVKETNAQKQTTQIAQDTQVEQTTQFISSEQSQSEDDTNFVFYFQDNNQPWSDDPHGSSTISSSGCGTTSLAMVLATLTGDTEKYTPGTIAEYQRENEIPTPNQQVDTIPLLCEKMDTGCCAEYHSGNLDLDLVDETLESGGYIILDAIADTGDESAYIFANYNHYIVIRDGNQKDGYYIANSLYRFSEKGSGYQYAPQNTTCIPAEKFTASYYYTILKKV